MNFLLQLHLSVMKKMLVFGVGTIFARDVRGHNLSVFQQVSPLRLLYFESHTAYLAFGKRGCCFLAVDTEVWRSLLSPGAVVPGAFLAPGICFVEHNFSTDWGWEYGFSMIQAHCIQLHPIPCGPVPNRLAWNLEDPRSVQWVLDFISAGSSIYKNSLESFCMRYLSILPNYTLIQ